MFINEDNGVKVCSLSEAEWHPYFLPEYNMRRKVFHSENLTWAMSEIPGGTTFAEGHSHPEEQILHVLQGSFDFQCGDKVYKLNPGDIIVIPSNVYHLPNVSSKENVICIEVFTPCRDYQESGKAE